MAASATLSHQSIARGYQWMASSNMTLSMLMATINFTILMISLPAIFRGIDVNPLHHGQTTGLLWTLIGFNVSTTILLASLGRISDPYGRVRLDNLGFLVFSIGTILLFLTPDKTVTGEWALTIFRFIQGTGGAFLFANRAAILTDAFPDNERGLARGLNHVAVGGNVIGLVAGGLLAAIGWRAIFLVNVPVGILGTVCAYVALKETATTRNARRINWWGNLAFWLVIIDLSLGFTDRVNPYKSHPMGWISPFVLTSLMADIALLLIALMIMESTVNEDASARMSLVPARFRGAAPGKRSTIINTGMMLSMGILYTMVIRSRSMRLTPTISKGLGRFLPVLAHLAHLPPRDELLAAWLGYHPLKLRFGPTTTGGPWLGGMPHAQNVTLTSLQVFPHLISHPFLDALRTVFIFAAAMTLLSAIPGVFRGGRFIDEPSGSHRESVALWPSQPSPLRKPPFCCLCLRYGWLRTKPSPLRRCLAFLQVALDQGRVAAGIASNEEMPRIAEMSVRPLATERVPQT